MNADDRFTRRSIDGIFRVVTELRELRHGAGLSQREFATLLAVPVNSFRMWDSGLRSVPVAMLQRAKDVAATQHADRFELLPLGRLAWELGVHRSTLQAAARTGRLEVQFSHRSVFGRPIRYATRAAGQTFMAAHYRRRNGSHHSCNAPLPLVPADYDQQLKTIRRSLRLTQGGLAHRIGAAGKAVVYQWESRKRIPSPVFWQRLLQL